MPPGDGVMYNAVHQIDGCGERDRAETLVFVIALTVARLPGLGGKSGAVVAIAWMPGFSS